MRRLCVKCGHHWFLHLSDGRRKCHHCGHRQSFRSVWNSARPGEATKRRLLEYFVLGVPVYRWRYCSAVSLKATERFFRLCRRMLAVAEEWRQPFAGRIECDEALFGRKCKGRHRWGATGKALVLGILQRDGRIKVLAAEGRGREELLPLIQQHTRRAASTTRTTGKPTPRWPCAAGMWSSPWSAVCRRGATTSTASRASGVTLSTGAINAAGCRKSSFTFTWPKLPSALITATRTYSP
jgi:hypothetical protein